MDEGPDLQLDNRSRDGKRAAARIGRVSAAMAAHTGESPLDQMRAVLRSADVTGNEQLALLVLVDRADTEGESYPSLALVAKQVGCRRQNIPRIMRSLRERGLVDWTPGGGRGRTNRYRIDRAAIADLEPINKSRTEDHYRSINSRTGDENRHRNSHTGTNKQSHRAPGKRAIEDGHLGESPAPAPRPPDGLVEIPVRQPGNGKSTPSTWWLTETTRVKIAAEYPGEDVVAVAEDLARKVRVGARDPYTYRGARKGLASWVAREAEGGGKQLKSVKQAARVEGRDWNSEGEWMYDCYRVSDHKTFGGGNGEPPHEKWGQYMEYAGDPEPRTALLFDQWVRRC